MKRLLIVSPHFPPVNAPDAQRVLGALPHLRSLGWEARVLCIDPRDIDLPSTTDSNSRVPADVQVNRCRARPSAFNRLLGMRTLGPRAAGPLLKAGSRIITDWKPDLVFFSTTQNAVVAAGPRWKRDHGVPFVVDVQDPWVTDYYDRPGSPKPPGGWKYAWSRRRNARLESQVFNAADGIVSVTADYLRDMAARHPRLKTTPQLSLPFGIDVAAFNEAIAHAPAPFSRDPGKIHLVSIGAVGPIMQSAVQTLFAQVRALRQNHPGLADRLRLHFIGTSYASADASVPSVMPIAREHDLDDLVVETTARVPWREAQAGMAAADGLILLTSDDPAYTPSKLAACFLARRPVLYVTNPDSATARLGASLGLGSLLDIARPDPDTLSAFIGDLTSLRPRWPENRKEDQFHHHTAEARTRELAVFFDLVLQNSRAS